MDPDPDFGSGIRIRVFPKPLDPDPGKTAPDPKPCLPEDIDVEHHDLTVLSDALVDGDDRGVVWVFN